MESVIIASPHPLDVIKRLGSGIVASTNQDGTVVVESHGARVYISEAPGIETEYEPGDLTVTCEAGIGLDLLARRTNPNGQWLPVDPPGLPRGTR